MFNPPTCPQCGDNQGKYIAYRDATSHCEACGYRNEGLRSLIAPQPPPPPPTAPIAQQSQTTDRVHTRRSSGSSGLVRMQWDGTATATMEGSHNNHTAPHPQPTTAMPPAPVPQPPPANTATSNINTTDPSKPLRARMHPPHMDVPQSPRVPPVEYQMFGTQEHLTCHPSERMHGYQTTKKMLDLNESDPEVYSD